MDEFAEEATKYPFMERDSYDYDIVMGKALREDKAFKTVYFETLNGLTPMSDQNRISSYNIIQYQPHRKKKTNNLGIIG